MTTFKKSLDTPEYFSVESVKIDGADTYTTYHQTAEEAIQEAASAWRHLTPMEQKHYTVTAWRVAQSNISIDSHYEDRPWWESTTDCEERLISFPVEVTLDREWEGGRVYVMTGTYRAVRVTCGYATGAEAGLHNHLDTYAIAELGAVDDDHNFVPDMWQECDIGHGILSKQLIGTPKACEGWDPDPDDEDIDWGAYGEWTEEVVERLLAS